MFGIRETHKVVKYGTKEFVIYQMKILSNATWLKAWYLLPVLFFYHLFHLMHFCKCLLVSRWFRPNVLIFQTLDIYFLFCSFSCCCCSTWYNVLQVSQISLFVWTYYTFLHGTKMTAQQQADLPLFSFHCGSQLQGAFGRKMYTFLGFFFSFQK